MRHVVLIVGAALVTGVVGCASSNTNLIRESARFMEVLPESVTVSNVSRSASSVTWQAESPSKGAWSCTSDDMLRRPLCVRRDSTAKKP